MSEPKKRKFSGDFHAVYVLCSQSPDRRYSGKCYIGYTNHPKRRINQHNRGRDFGGAKRTDNKGPWQMVLYVHGFPNRNTALQFEWAWQMPNKSSRLKDCNIRRRRPRETFFQFNFRVLGHMLCVGPWNRLSLTVHWLEQNYKCDFEQKMTPHLQIVNGVMEAAVTPSKNSQSSNTPLVAWTSNCSLCFKPITQQERSRMRCLNFLCSLTCHMICLANYMLATDQDNPGHYVPITGSCPLCGMQLMWVALVQHKNKVQSIADDDDASAEDSDVESDSEFDKTESNEEISDNSSNEVFEVNEDSN